MKMREQFQKRVRYVNSREVFNKMLEIAQKLSITVACAPPKRMTLAFNTNMHSFINDKARYVELTTRWVTPIYKDGIDSPNSEIIDCVKRMANEDKYVCTYIYDKDNAGLAHVNDSALRKKINAIYKPFNMVEKYPILLEYSTIVEGKALVSAKPILGSKAQYNKKWIDAYEYDLNSAYSSILLDKIIDTYNFRFFSKVAKNEVGFKIQGLDIVMVHSGIADIVFPLIDSPFKAFILENYEAKKKAPKGSRERDIAKGILNHMVGLWQKDNPFLRAYVVLSCNERIQHIIDANKEVVMWNTDAVFSTIPLQLDIGENIGQFKLEYHGKLAYNGCNYQTEKEISYRGISKGDFEENFDITRDEVVKKNIRKTYFDLDTYRIKEK